MADIVELTLGRLLRERSPLDLQQHPLRLLEPACGAGVFLVGAYQYLLDWHLRSYLTAGMIEPLRQVEGVWQLAIAERQRILLTSLYGVDIDLQAVTTTRQALVQVFLEGLSPTEQLLWGENTLNALTPNIHCGDAVMGPDTGGLNWEQQFPQIFPGGFDAVIGNPPYVDAETMSLHAAASRRYCAAHYQTATGNWDLFCVFVEQAIALCQPGGLTSLIVPNKLTSASYAAATRQLLACQNRLLTIHDYSQVKVFPVAVYPIVYLAQKQPPQPGDTVEYARMSHATDPPSCQLQRTLDYSHFTRPHHPWIFGQDAPLIHRLQAEFASLQDVATVLGAATVAEAYHLQPLIRDRADPTALKLVNSGTIDRYWLGWGQRPCRYLGQTYLYPVIPNDQITALPPKRHWQATQPKLILAGMTRTLECSADLNGAVLAAKSTTIILSTLELRYLLALLNSKLLNFCYQQWFGGDRFRGGYLRIGPRQLRQLPIKVPTEGDRPLVDPLLSLVDQRLTLAAGPEATQLDCQIDGLVYQLYQLNATEIAQIEATP